MSKSVRSVQDLLASLPEPARGVVLEAFAGISLHALGITPENILAYYHKSASEGDGDLPRVDTVGKFKHGLRLGEKPVAEGEKLPRLGDAVDILWPFLEPSVTRAVAAVLDAYGLG